LSHELVHAFDQCRAHIKWNNLVQHACTEIRASALSGECDIAQEINRGKVMFNIAGKHQDCVKRRAELSVAMNPHCASKEKAAEAVAEAFHNCYNDTAPFDRMP
jgi:mitochondrial inner membrane protease ATP23